MSTLASNFLHDVVVRYKRTFIVSEFVYLLFIWGRFQLTQIKYRQNLPLNIDIFVNCNWVDTRWQKYSTHLHTNNT